MEIYFLKRALADQVREAEFWREQSPELEPEFLEALDGAIQKICLAPNGYTRASAVRPSEIRRFYEKRFHTHILYRYFPEQDRLRIVRIYGARMNPRKFLP